MKGSNYHDGMFVLSFPCVYSPEHVLELESYQSRDWRAH